MVNWLDLLLLPEPTPALLNASTGTINDCAAVDLAGNYVSAIRFTGVAPAVTGIANPYDGRRLHLEAVGGPLVLSNENASSAAANRIKTGTGANVTIQQDASAWLVYDASSSRWRLTTSGGLMTDGGTPLANSSTGTLNDVVTTDATGAESSAVRFSGVAPTINGFASGRDGRRMFVLATGGPVVFTDDNAGSAAANRIKTGTGGNVTVPNGGGGLLVYDGTSSRWRVVAIGAASGGGGSPGGSNTQVQFNDSSAFGGDAGMTFNKATGLFTVTIGAFGSGTKASAGDIRGGSSYKEVTRNNGNTDDIYIVEKTTADNLYVGCDAAQTGSKMPNSTIYGVASGGSHSFRVNALEFFSAAAAAVTVGAPLVINTATPATTGTMRFPSAFTQTERNNANSANATVLAGNTLDELFVGSANDQTSTPHANVYVKPSGNVILGVGATHYAVLGTSNVRLGMPLRGDGSNSAVPFRLEQCDITQNTTADTTLSSSQYDCPVLNITGMAGGAFNIIAPNTAKAIYLVVNGNTSSATIKKAGGAGFAIAAGKSAWARHNGTDYVRASADA